MKQYIAVALIALFATVSAQDGPRDVSCEDTFFRLGRFEGQCVDFFVCMDSRRVDFFCNEGDIFDTDRRTCRRGDAENCVFTTIPIPADACAGVFNEIRPHPDPFLCRNFYMCLNSNIVVFRCQEGYIFNDYAQRCIPGDEETCQETPSAPYEIFLKK